MIENVETGEECPGEDVVEGNERGLNGFRERFYDSEGAMTFGNRLASLVNTISRSLECFEGFRQHLS